MNYIQRICQPCCSLLSSPDVIGKCVILVRSVASCEDSGESGFSVKFAEAAGHKHEDCMVVTGKVWSLFTCEDTALAALQVLVNVFLFLIKFKFFLVPIFTRFFDKLAHSTMCLL